MSYNRQVLCLQIMLCLFSFSHLNTSNELIEKKYLSLGATLRYRLKQFFQCIKQKIEVTRWNMLTPQEKKSILTVGSLIFGAIGGANTYLLSSALYVRLKKSNIEMEHVIFQEIKKCTENIEGQIFENEKRNQEKERISANTKEVLLRLRPIQNVEIKDKVVIITLPQKHHLEGVLCQVAINIVHEAGFKLKIQHLQE